MRTPVRETEATERAENMATAMFGDGRVRMCVGLVMRNWVLLDGGRKVTGATETTNHQSRRQSGVEKTRDTDTK